MRSLLFADSLPVLHGTGTFDVPLTPLDRDLLKRCLGHQPGSWNDFIDRYLGLIYHVINHASHLRSVRSDRRYRRSRLRGAFANRCQRLCSAAAVSQGEQPGHLSHRHRSTHLRPGIGQAADVPRGSTATGRQACPEPEEGPSRGMGLETLEEVAKLLKRLPSRERRVVRLHYLEGRSYEEISTQLGIPVNTIGPILSRARKKLREGTKATHRTSPPVGRPAHPKPGSE